LIQIKRELVETERRTAIDAATNLLKAHIASVVAVAIELLRAEIISALLASHTCRPCSA
jgi:hypothetical protein